MRDVVAVDEAVLPYDGTSVLHVLGDVHSYGNWWPRPFQIEAITPPPAAIGARLRVRQGPLLSWSATLSAIESDHVGFSLSEGSVEGEVRWTVRPVLEGTALVLRVDVDVRPWWLRTWSWRRDVRKGHARRIKNVFDALETRLEKTGAERLPEPQPPPPRAPLSIHRAAAPEGAQRRSTRRRRQSDSISID